MHRFARYDVNLFISIKWKNVSWLAPATARVCVCPSCAHTHTAHYTIQIFNYSNKVSLLPKFLQSCVSGRQSRRDASLYFACAFLRKLSKYTQIFLTRTGENIIEKLTSCRRHRASLKICSQISDESWQYF